VVLVDAPLVLGSASPRRREILDRAGVVHVVVAGSADETVLPHEAPGHYLERVVLAKLDAVRAVLPASLATSPILVADTSVILDGDILGKPQDALEARAMLVRLSGRDHHVHTRFVIALAGSVEPAHAETVSSQVTFRALGRSEVEANVASGEGMDKAGGYAVQGLASAYVSRILGSYTNVMGLPASEVVVALRRLGIR
jgi:septum formation protein